jgi:hypothetical protein
MCFSAQASFGVGTLLLPAGVYCIQSAARKCPSYLPLAMTPLAFGLQQYCEGFVWLGRSHSDGALVQMASLAYLQFALFFWPFWIPFSILFLQSSWKKGLVIGLLAFVGFLQGVTLSLPLVLEPDLVNVTDFSHSIQYEFAESPALKLMPWSIWKVLYLAVVATPILMSDSKEVVVVGLALIVLAVVSHFVSAFAFISVWCFFAAVLSVYLCWIFARLNPVPDHGSHVWNPGEIEQEVGVQ